MNELVVAPPPIEEALPISEPPKIIIPVKCCRCLHVIDPVKDPEPFQYSARSKLCDKCVKELGIRKLNFWGDRAAEPAKRGRPPEPTQP
jgi:hypothetical protein